MSHLICKLPNASKSINGIEFTEREGGGLISVAPLSEDEHALFAGIPGYEVAEAAKQKADKQEEEKPAAPVTAPEPVAPAADAAAPAAEGATETAPAAAPKATAKKK